MPNTPERIQKVLARSGAGSRREIEAWIKNRRLSVNGRVATLGDKITVRDKVHLDGELLRFSNIVMGRTRILAYHKPAGEVCTRKDEKSRPTVFTALPGIRNGKWINIGRLDINTSGLLLFTNNGDLANRLMHPAYEIEREYAVRVLGEVSKVKLNKLLVGVELEDGMARFDSIHDGGGKGSNHWYHVVIREGRNRAIRRLWESQGITVSRLIRVRYGPLRLSRNIRPGHYEELDQIMVNKFLQAVDDKG
jgi:23S rRNA pseudouridine2605 synthase